MWFESPADKCLRITNSMLAVLPEDASTQLEGLKVGIIGEDELREAAASLSFDISNLSGVINAVAAYEEEESFFGVRKRPVILVTPGAASLPDHQLAFIIGHEMGHHVAGHLPRQLELRATRGSSGSTIGMLVGMGLSLLFGSDDTFFDELLAGFLGSRAGERLALSPEEKEMEFEADRLGLIFSAFAGYSPVGAFEVLAYFDQSEQDGALSSFMNALFGTHPPARERMERLDSYIESVTGQG